MNTRLLGKHLPGKIVSAGGVACIITTSLFPPSVRADSSPSCTGSRATTYQSCVDSALSSCGQNSEFVCGEGDHIILLKSIADRAIARCSTRLCRSLEECHVFSEAERTQLATCAASQLNLIKSLNVRFLFDVGTGSVLKKLVRTATQMVQTGTYGCRCPV
jgi:hypothetical protein